MGSPLLVSSYDRSDGEKSSMNPAPGLRLPSDEPNGRKTMIKRTALYVLVAGLFLVQLGPLAAGASASPGPALRTPRGKLAAALKCHGPVTRGGRQPVLLLPAAQRTPESNWDGGY